MPSTRSAKPAAKTATRRPARGPAPARRGAGGRQAGAADIPEFYRPDTYKPDDSVGYLMRRIINTVSAEIQRQLDPGGLTNAQWVPLLKLYMGTASTVAELSRVCYLDTGGMTRLLDRLEAKGLVRRARSVEDRRVVNLELTDEGRAVAKEIPAILCGVQNAHMRGFSASEWQLLKAMLRRILDNAEAIQAENSERPQ